MKHADLINRMTLEEKASLLSGRDFWHTKAIDRLYIPALSLSDGPHGIRKQADAGDHLGLSASMPATCFPTAAAIANSWDIDLGEEIGRLLAEEGRALDVDVILGPGLNIKRSPLCGRNFEYFSEDPYLSGKMAAAYIRGIQTGGLSACPKHFAANNQELLRMHSDSVLDERTLREIYLTAFEIAVKEGSPHVIMSSYNRVNGVYTNENPHLLRDILVDEWGFKGFVVSDWGGSNDHTAGTIAGAHLEMPAPGPSSDCELIDAVRGGALKEDVLNERVDELLQNIFAIKRSEGAASFDIEQHHNAARKAAAESIVLLKNEGAILPLKAGTKTALIGDFAERPRYQGAGSSLVNPTKLDNTLTCIGDSGLVMAGYAQGFNRNGKPDRAKIEAACELAKKADVVLLYLGLAEISETEGLDRLDMGITQNQIDLLDAVSAVNPNVVIVLSCGSAIEMPWIDKGRACIHGYLSGQAGAGAMLDVLTGKVCPSGKLGETWPLALEDTPAFRYFPGKERTAEYREALYVGYRYYDTAAVPVRFPFGYGLSYTTFAYSVLKADATQVSFTIANTGTVAGAEIAQLYIGKHENAVFRPKKELKGFTKVFLQPGESKTVTITLDDKAFRYFNVKTSRFEVETGTYGIMIGASSADIRLSAAVSVPGANASEGSDTPDPYNPAELPSYYSGRVGDVSDREFETLLGRPIPEAQWDRGKPLGRNDSLSQLFYAKSLLARITYRILTNKKNKAEAGDDPDPNILYIYYMPFRGLAKVTGGSMDLPMVDGFLEIVNGHFFVGAGLLIAAWIRKGKADRALTQKLRDAEKLHHTESSG
ncbi:glycosyl hydrolase [Spirochaetia bacterium]|nr:glycosyl hydrolase [Spirochaetia bacterium]